MNKLEERIMYVLIVHISIIIIAALPFVFWEMIFNSDEVIWKKIALGWLLFLAWAVNFRLLILFAQDFKSVWGRS